MRFWKYGMVRKEYGASAGRRSMSYATKPKQFITLRTARMMFVASTTLAIFTAAVTRSRINHEKYVNDMKYREFLKNRNGYDDDKAKKKH